MDIFRTQTTLERIGLRPGQKVLEVGSGWGRLLIPAAKRVLPGGEVVGLNLLPNSTKQLQERAAQARVTNLKAVTGDAVLPHFPADTFDLVYICTALGEISDPQAAIKQCYAVLKAGGILSITEMIPDPHYQAQGKVCALAETTGFEFVRVEGSWLFYTMNFRKPLIKQS